MIDSAVAGTTHSPDLPPPPSRTDEDARRRAERAAEIERVRREIERSRDVALAELRSRYADDVPRTRTPAWIWFLVAAVAAAGILATLLLRADLDALRRRADAAAVAAADQLSDRDARIASLERDVREFESNARVVRGERDEAVRENRVLSLRAAESLELRAETERLRREVAQLRADLERRETVTPLPAATRPSRPASPPRPSPPPPSVHCINVGTPLEECR